MSISDEDDPCPRPLSPIARELLVEAIYRRQPQGAELLNIEWFRNFSDEELWRESRQERKAGLL